MSLEKIILYYGFTPIADPEAVRLWQRTLCESLGLKGRIIISADGINGTLGGDMNALKRYVRVTKEYQGFRSIDFKWSAGRAADFPKLRVRVRDEIVTFGAPGELKVDANGVVGGGTHLTPQQVNDLVAQRGDEVAFFDGRNSFEARIGKFKNAIVPDVDSTRDFVNELDSGKYDHLKDKPIVTYCTGGIRCEVLSSLMKNRGFNEVYQIEGGIVRYGEAFGDQGLWEGSLYVFDKRMNVDFTEDAVTIGTCEVCQSPTSKLRDCTDDQCREFTLLCDGCAKQHATSPCSHTGTGLEWLP